LASIILWHDAPAILATFQDITRRKVVERALKDAHAELGIKVQNRTAELQKANEALLREIEEHKRTSEEKDQLNEQLRQAQKMEAVGQLAGGIAHDFNNLLTVILGYSDLIKQTISEDSPYKTPIRLINDAGNRAKNLTRQLLAFSRKQMLEMRTVDVNRVIGEFENLLRSTIGENIHIKIVPNAIPLMVKADVSQLEQILMNLAINARDAMPEGGFLTIQTSRIDFDESYATRKSDIAPGPYVMIAISDTGVGMDKETLDRIFEPFFTTKALGHGTGLGLATVYGAVKQHGGDIWVYSEPNKGTIFKIFLPVSNEKLFEEKTKNEAKIKHVGKPTVLVVEDEPSVMGLVCNILDQGGYQVLGSRDEYDAVVIARQSDVPIDLLLTDVIMPNMKGPEVFKKVSTYHPAARVLYMSGYNEDMISRQGVILNEIYLLQKPFSAESLLEKVSEILST